MNPIRSADGLSPATPTAYQNVPSPFPRFGEIPSGDCDSCPMGSTFWSRNASTKTPSCFDVIVAFTTEPTGDCDPFTKFERSPVSSIGTLYTTGTVHVVPCEGSGQGEGRTVKYGPAGFTMPTLFSEESVYPTTSSSGATPKGSDALAPTIV